jgi:hypothetical protein
MAAKAATPAAKYLLFLRIPLMFISPLDDVGAQCAGEAKNR